MKAAVIKQHGPAESILFEERPIPNVGAGQVLVRVRACGLNHLDIWVRKGVPGHKFPLPLVPGSDIAGIVEQVGSQVTQIKVKDRVLINPGIFCGQCVACKEGAEHLCSRWGLLGETCDGGCQEYIVVDACQAYVLSNAISFEKAACIPITYITAWQMLVGKAKVKSGEKILIHAAGSGVSVACIQIAKFLGLSVFVTSTSEEKLYKAKSLGVDRFINTSKEKFTEAVRNLTSKLGVDVVVDHVGAPTFMDSIRCLRRGGRLVSCGATAGSNLELDWKHVFFKNIALFGSTYGTRADFAEVMKHIEEGHFSPVIDTVVSFEEIHRAHQLIEDRKAFGKVIVRITA